MIEDDEEQGEDYTLTIELPPGAVAQHGVAIASYFDAGGETKYGLTLQGSAPLSSILGLLEIVKLRVVQEAEGW